MPIQYQVLIVLVLKRYRQRKIEFNPRLRDEYVNITGNANVNMNVFFSI